MRLVIFDPGENEHDKARIPNFKTHLHPEFLGEKKSKLTRVFWRWSHIASHGIQMPSNLLHIAAGTYVTPPFSTRSKNIFGV